MKKIGIFLLLSILIISLSSCTGFDVASMFSNKVNVTVINSAYYTDTTPTTINLVIYKDNQKVFEKKGIKSGVKVEGISLDKGEYKFEAVLDGKTYSDTINVNSEMTIIIKANEDQTKLYFEAE